MYKRKNGYAKNTITGCVHTHNEWKSKDYLIVCWDDQRRDEGKEKHPLSVGAINVAMRELQLEENWKDRSLLISGIRGCHRCCILYLDEPFLHN